MLLVTEEIPVKNDWKIPTRIRKEILVVISADTPKNSEGIAIEISIILSRIFRGITEKYL